MKIKLLRAKEALLRLIMEEEQELKSLRESIDRIDANGELTTMERRAELKAVRIRIKAGMMMLRDNKRAYGLMNGRTYSEAKGLDAFNELVMVCEDIKNELGQNDD